MAGGMTTTARPATSGRRWRGCLGPNAVRPPGCDCQVAGHHLGRAQAQVDEAVWIVEVADPQIVGQLVDAQGSSGAGHQRELEHGVGPAGEVAERLAARGFGLVADVPNVVVGVVGSATALWLVLVERVARLACLCGFEIGKTRYTSTFRLLRPTFQRPVLRGRGRAVGQ